MFHKHQNKIKQKISKCVLIWNFDWWSLHSYLEFKNTKFKQQQSELNKIISTYQTEHWCEEQRLYTLNIFTKSKHISYFTKFKPFTKKLRSINWGMYVCETWEQWHDKPKLDCREMDVRRKYVGFTKVVGNCWSEICGFHVLEKHMDHRRNTQIIRYHPHMERDMVLHSEPSSSYGILVRRKDIWMFLPTHHSFKSGGD